MMHTSLNACLHWAASFPVRQRTRIFTSPCPTALWRSPTFLTCEGSATLPKFGLQEHVTYSSEVEAASLDQDGRSPLQVRQCLMDSTPGQTKQLNLSADALIVATGANQVPKETPEGLSRLQGRLPHSSEYNDAFKGAPREARDRKLKVLVAGRGEIGGDIAAETGDLSPHVTVWLRKGIVLAPEVHGTSTELRRRSRLQRTRLPIFPSTTFSNPYR